MNCSEYFSECQRLAEEAVELAMQSRDLKASELDASDIDEFIFEMVDGHEWIIYTRYALNILQHTDNDDALFEVGDLSDVDSASSVYTSLAFWAMREDVLQELDAALQKAIDAEEEEEEESQNDS